MRAGAVPCPESGVCRVLRIQRVESGRGTGNAGARAGCGQPGRWDEFPPGTLSSALVGAGPATDHVRASARAGPAGSQPSRGGTVTAGSFTQGCSTFPPTIIQHRLLGSCFLPLLKTALLQPRPMTKVCQCLQKHTCICSGTPGSRISTRHWLTAGVCRQAFPHVTRALSQLVKHHPRKAVPPGHGTLASQDRHAPTLTSLFLPPCPVHPPGSPAAGEHPCSSPSRLKLFSGTNTGIPKKLMCTMGTASVPRAQRCPPSIPDSFPLTLPGVRQGKPQTAPSSQS